MLVASRGELSFASPPFILPDGSFVNDITVRSRRLQLILHLLAQLSSAATLLDDYVRGTMNIAQRLFVAWESVVVAVKAGEMMYRERGGNVTHKKGPGSRGGLGTCGKRQKSTGASLSLSPDGKGSVESFEVFFDSYLLLEDQAACRVEYTRRAVIAALFEQFLQVTVDRSTCDLELLGWLGSEFLRPSSSDSPNYNSHFFNRCRTDKATWQTDEGQFLFKDSNTKKRNAYDEDSEGTCTSPVFKRARCRVGSSLWKVAPNNQRIGGDDEYENTPLSFGFFSRAAVAFNPTVCALELMSRCTLYARNIRNVDHEIAVSDSDASRVVEGFFYVVVRARTVGICEHSEPCFGNRKFLFVRCKEFDRKRKHDLDAAKDWKLSSISSFLSDEFYKSLAAGSDGCGDATEGGKHLLANSFAQSLTHTQSMTRNDMIPSLNLPKSVRDVLFLKRTFSNFSARHIPNLCSRASCLPRGTSSVRLPPIVSGVKGSGSAGAGERPGEADSEDVRSIMSGAKRSHDLESQTAFTAYSDSSDDEESEESLQSWFVMHCNRCSVTGSFFGTPNSHEGRLITNTNEPLKKSVFHPADLFDSYDGVMSFNQAILVPPNAGHDTNYRKRPTNEHLGVADEPVSAGQLAFAEELLAQLRFWRARGEPRRCYYYTPTAVGDSKTVKKQFLADAESDAVGDFDSLNNAWKGNVLAELPLKLLFTRLGTIQFLPLEDSVYCNGRGQYLLGLALAESTELVICATRESRPHSGWHDHRRRRRGRKEGRDVLDGCTLSDDDREFTSWGRYEDIAMKATVQWAQGEATTDDEDDDGNDYSDDDKNGSYYCNNGDGFLATADKNHSAQSKIGRLSKQRLLSAVERRQRRNERLKTEARFACSQRIDALLVHSPTAKPIATLTLRAVSQEITQSSLNKQLLQPTTFHVACFSHFVSRLLRHLREEKIIMVDMDRTLVDNAIIDDDDHLSSEDSVAKLVTEKRRRNRRGRKHRYEARKDVQYFVGNAPHRPMQRETIYVRPGVRKLLRRFGVEWDIPLVLVTKSSRQRTEAILSQLLDPHDELFHAARGLIVTAESIMHSVLCDTSSFSASSSAHSSFCSFQGKNDKWRVYQEKLMKALKSTKAVLREFDSVLAQEGKSHSLFSKARSVAVLDDSPHIWTKEDWCCTVAPTPYTLGCVDPRGYFTANGLIASLLLSALYRSECVVCPLPQCKQHRAEPRCTGVLKEENCNDTELRLGVSDVVSCESESLRGIIDEGQYETERCEGVLPRLRLPSISSTRRADVLGDDIPLYAEDSAVVEEVGTLQENHSWNTADVEDVTPL